MNEVRLRIKLESKRGAKEIESDEFEVDRRRRQGRLFRGRQLSLARGRKFSAGSAR